MLNSRHPDEALCELVMSMTSPIELVFCLHQKSPDSPYPMALAATYVSIRQRTNHLLRLHLIIDSTVQKCSLQRLRDTIKAEDQLHVLHASAVSGSHPNNDRIHVSVECQRPADIVRMRFVSRPTRRDHRT